MASRVKEDEKNERIIRGLLKLPENRRCINCNSLVRNSSHSCPLIVGCIVSWGTCTFDDYMFVCHVKLLICNMRCDIRIFQIEES